MTDTSHTTDSQATKFTVAVYDMDYTGADAHVGTLLDSMVKVSTFDDLASAKSHAASINSNLRNGNRFEGGRGGLRAIVTTGRPAATVRFPRKR